MKLTNIGPFKNITHFVTDKIERFKQVDKDCKSLFLYMFSERDNIFFESSQGYRVTKTTYGECFDEIVKLIPIVKEKLKKYPKNSIVGLYLQNSPEFIKMLWAVIGAGYRPLLLNLRLNNSILNEILTKHDVKACITDSQTFDVYCIQLNEILNEPTKDNDSLSDFSNEIIFMSSGTSGSVKLCAYNGENLFYQVCDSLSIIENCPKIKEHYQGELKQLTLLPFYHIFGFVAVYIWFGFFSRTFVFLKDLSPDTLVNTVKKHKVTHIFAVTLVWETIYKKAIQTIKARGEKTYKKFQKGLKIALKGGFIGKLIQKHALKEVRENIFGDSIKFLISGGSSINKETLEFFNGIGYHLANGYGMTEVGITSVEFSNKNSVLCSKSIGAPFNYTEYQINDSGELLIKSKTRAYKIIEDNKETITDYNEFFHTRDLAKRDGNRFFIQGRLDDLIVANDGENINPELIEGNLKIVDADNLALIADKNGSPVLLISAKTCFTDEKYQHIYDSALQCLTDLRLEKVVKNIAITRDNLLGVNDFKMSRKKIATKFQSGEIALYVVGKATEDLSGISDLEKEILNLFSQVLKKSADQISLTDDFFIDLGGSSLDYFELLNEIKLRFNCEISSNNDKMPSTVKEFYEFLKNI